MKKRKKPAPDTKFRNVIVSGKSVNEKGEVEKRNFLIRVPDEGPQEFIENRIKAAMLRRIHAGSNKNRKK